MPISYKFISGIGLNVPQQEGYCVPEYLINFYTKIKLSVERIEAIIRKGLGLRNHEPVEYTIDAIKHFCNHFKISHYALDVENKYCYKNIVDKSNYAALIYYIIEHMYPVTDKRQEKQL